VSRTKPIPQCRVFLVGEGPDDIGDLAEHPAYRKGREGFLQPILRGLVAGRVELGFDGAKITHLPARPIRNPGKGHARKAAQALALAHVENADALVFVKDVDRTAGSAASAIERRKRIDETRRQIVAGFEAARSRAPVGKDIAAIAATPCRMIEAWALADWDAVCAAAGAEHPDEAKPPKPEDLWGNEDDPASDHPKRVLERALGRRATRDDFAEIAGGTRVNEISARCPDSFRTFAREVEHALRRRLSQADEV